MFWLRLHKLDELSFLALILRDITSTNFIESTISRIEAFKVATVHKFDALLPVELLNRDVVLRTQLLLVGRDVILVETLDALYDDEVAVDEALEKILEEFVFLQSEFVRWDRNGVLFFQNEQALSRQVVQGLRNLLLN